MNSVLCIFAHPDDEIFAGGTLAHLAEHGVQLHLLCVTHGENGAPGYPPIPDRSQLGRIRTEEMHCAAEAIGAASLKFLDYVDEVGPDGGMIAFSHDPLQFEAEIIAAIDTSNAEVVITHGSDGEYGHPAHRLIHTIVMRAARSMGDAAPLVYGFQADFEGHPDKQYANTSDPAHIVLTTRRYLHSHVMPMFECHHTQSSWWIHLKTEKLGRPATPDEAWHLHPREGLHRHWPPVNSQPVIDLFVEWLKQNPLEVHE